MAPSPQNELLDLPFGPWPTRAAVFSSTTSTSGTARRCASSARAWRWPDNPSASTSPSSGRRTSSRSFARGREKLHYLNPAPISEISERWINRAGGRPYEGPHVAWAPLVQGEQTPARGETVLADIAEAETFLERLA